jgi:putative MATE family efflux protein
LSGRILPTFFYYALTSTIGLIAITTANLVDGVFVGRAVGGQALAAITLLLPIFTLLFAIALMFAIGGSVAAGKWMGAGEEEQASNVFSQTLMATMLLALGFALASYGFEDPLYRALNVPADLLHLVTEYFGIIRWVLGIQLTTMVLYYFVRADDHPMLATVALLIGALGNIALDALFIIHFQMGLRGAAYAVAISQTVQAGVLCSYFFSKNRSLRFIFKQRRWGPLVEVAFNGVSEFINEVSAGIIFWILNLLLVARLGVSGLAAFSIVSYFIYLSLMLSYGIADALHLVASQNFGSRNQERIRKFLTTALTASLGIGVTLALSIFAGRRYLAGWFLDSPDDAIAESAIQLILVVWPLFLVNGTNVIFSCYLTAIQKPRPSATIAILRGLILPAGLLLLLNQLLESWASPQPFSEWMFLAALPLAEWFTFALALWLAFRNRPSSLGLNSIPAET